jgi:hypothetical protein
MWLIYGLLLFLGSLGAIWLLGTLLGFALDTFPLWDVDGRAHR